MASAREVSKPISRFEDFASGLSGAYAPDASLPQQLFSAETDTPSALLEQPLGVGLNILQGVIPIIPQGVGLGTQLDAQALIAIPEGRLSMPLPFFGMSINLRDLTRPWLQIPHEGGRVS